MRVHAASERRRGKPRNPRSSRVLDEARELAGLSERLATVIGDQYLVFDLNPELALEQREGLDAEHHPLFERDGAQRIHKGFLVQRDPEAMTDEVIRREAGLLQRVAVDAVDV